MFVFLLHYTHSGTGRLFFSNHSILSNRVSRFAFLNWIAVSDKVRLTVTELNSIVSLLLTIQTIQFNVLFLIAKS